MRSLQTGQSLNTGIRQTMPLRHSHFGQTQSSPPAADLNKLGPLLQAALADIQGEMQRLQTQIEALPELQKDPNLLIEIRAGQQAILLHSSQPDTLRTLLLQHQIVKAPIQGQTDLSSGRFIVHVLPQRHFDVTCHNEEEPPIRFGKIPFDRHA